jgi:hypothetical protein
MILKFKENSNIESVPIILTWFMFGIWSRRIWESCAKHANLASWKIRNFLEQGKASVFNLQFELYLEILDKYQTMWGLPISRTTERRHPDCGATAVFHP